MNRAFTVAATGALASSFAFASTPVVVEITGEVEQNQITAGELEEVVPGAPVTLSFTIHATNFMDSPNFPTRGYAIDPGSFSLAVGGAELGLQNPFPAGQTPYFVLRDNDPAVDGFFISTNLDAPVGVPTDESGLITQFMNNFSVTYDGDTLFSLDVLDALGEYDFTGLSVFNWSIDDGGFSPMLILFSQMSIGLPPCPADFDGCGLVNGQDLAVLLSNWGPCPEGQPCLGELTGDNVVNGADLAAILASWGSCGN